MKLYIKDFKRRRTVREFLEDCFKHFFPATYRDKECAFCTCVVGRQRSIDDIYNVVSTYYTSIKRERFEEIFSKFIKETRVKGRYCGHAKAFVFSEFRGVETDPDYPFLFKLGDLAHNNKKMMEKYGFKNERYNLENLKLIMK